MFVDIQSPPFKKTTLKSNRHRLTLSVKKTAWTDYTALLDTCHWINAYLSLSAFYFPSKYNIAPFISERMMPTHDFNPVATTLKSPKCVVKYVLVS